jgi:hypothetical protein
MKLAIGMPWYDGPDVKTFAMYQDFFMYLGQLRERTIFRGSIGKEKFDKMLPTLPSLHIGADPTVEDYDRMGKLDIALIDYSQTSLVGKARDLIIEGALQWEADYVFMWDADMGFEYSSFLDLWRHNVPVVGALAFTARPPFYPVIMRIIEQSHSNDLPSFTSEIVFDYPKDQLITNKDVGGAIAFGSGVILLKTAIFKQIPQPWFYSTGCGEDFHFCTRCHEYGIQRYVDTSVKTTHKRWDVDFISEEYYEKYKAENQQVYKDNWPETVGIEAVEK